MKPGTTLLITLTLVASLLSGQATTAMAKAAPLTVIYGNDVRGELAPCG
jgi:hypothetical protein